MLSYFLLPFMAGLSYVLSQPAVAFCTTSTVEVIVPTTTVTYTTPPTTWVYPTTAQNLGTFTLVVRVSSTSTLGTVTSTSTVCDASDSTYAKTVYTTAGATAHSRKRETNALAIRQDAVSCTVTTTFTTTVGQTQVLVPGPSTKTYTGYTAYMQATVTTTSSIGTTYVMASAVTTTSPPGASCAATVTQDARCAPSAMVSAAGGLNNTQYGLEYKSDVPASGASYSTTTPDASSCCQMCADLGYSGCAGSAWDIRTNRCTLEFPVDFATGATNCGESMLVYYDAGPNSPMEPGTGLWVADICGSAEYGNAKPDDGT